MASQARSSARWLGVRRGEPESGAAPSNQAGVPARFAQRSGRQRLGPLAVGGKGVWVGIAIAAPLALILGLVLLLGGGSSIASSTGLTAGMTGGAALNEIRSTHA